MQKVKKRIIAPKLLPRELLVSRVLSVWDFSGGTVVKNPPANAGDMGSSPAPEDSTCHRATKPVRHNY